MSGLLFQGIESLVTMDDGRRVLRGVDLRIRDGWITAIGKGLPVEEGERVIDGSRLVVFPGFVNTHHHLNQTLQRCVPYVQDAKLFDWLVGLYEIWRHLTPGSVRAGASVGIAELLLTGCTTVADHFYVFPKGVTGELLDTSIEVARELGVRFHPTRGSMSRGRSQGGLPPDEVCQTEEEILIDSERVISRYHDASKGSMLRIGLSPCSPFSVTEGLMRDIAGLARAHDGVRLHTHLAETEDENAYCLSTYGVRPLALMARLGWLGPDVWFAHGVHFTDAELDLLAATQTGVAHCPTSNLRLGSGIARIPEMMARDVPVGLAVDGSASNDSSSMSLEIRQAMLVHRVGTGVDRMPVADALWLATRGGARVLGRDDIGILEVGKAADLAAFSIDDIGFAGAHHDWAAAPFLSFGTGRTTYTVVNGQVVVDQGELKTADLQRIVSEGQTESLKMLKRAGNRTGIDYLANPHPRGFNRQA